MAGDLYNLTCPKDLLQEAIQNLHKPHPTTPLAEGWLSLMIGYHQLLWSFCYCCFKASVDAELLICGLIVFCLWHCNEPQDLEEQVQLHLYFPTVKPVLFLCVFFSSPLSSLLFNGSSTCLVQATSVSLNQWQYWWKIAEIWIHGPSSSGLTHKSVWFVWYCGTFPLACSCLYVWVSLSNFAILATLSYQPLTHTFMF